MKNREVCITISLRLAFLILSLFGLIVVHKSPDLSCFFVTECFLAACSHVGV
jgi:hypothetical protein